CAEGETDDTGEKHCEQAHLQRQHHNLDQLRINRDNEPQSRVKSFDEIGHGRTGPGLLYQWQRYSIRRQLALLRCKKSSRSCKGRPCEGIFAGVLSLLVAKDVPLYHQPAVVRRVAGPSFLRVGMTQAEG